MSAGASAVMVAPLGVETLPLGARGVEEAADVLAILDVPVGRPLFLAGGGSVEVLAGKGGACTIVFSR
ncbi:hypothetical protein F2Q70_00013417 [Brassica cretica]|uniref:Uncharacterized protein n=1 Tax=Brassica cretica TaxID=69181 RepID=A0A8S9M4D7_BRACR|nr:hypothetical protein F2Q70_00013417 [Brassica cretica]